MLTSLILPLFGLLSIYHTFHTLIQYIQNPFLLFISIALTIFLQVVFIDQILPYNSQFNTKYLLFRYIYPLWQSYCTNQAQYHIMLPTPFTFTTEKRQNRSLIQDVTPFLNNIIFPYTNPLPFETEPHILHTIPLEREHSDSYLYYIHYKTLDITPSQTPFQVIFNPVKGINSGTFHRTIHPQNITLSIQDVFRTYMQKLIEFNENQDTPLYRPSHLQELKHRSEYFEVPDLDTKVQRHDNPHYWLQREILQIKHFQYRFLTTLSLRMT